MGLKIEIISRENIKPALPTPQHLSTYRVSLFDQFSTHVYVPMVYFYINDISSHSAMLNNIDDATQERRLRLKQSLSQTLARYYPFAGKVKENNNIECDDNGVYYVEARVTDYCLSDLLKKPDCKLLHELLPFHPRIVSSLGKTYLVMVQVNLFDCGGIAIGIYTSHKIIDGQSYMTFMNSWAAASRGSKSEEPSFISPSLFLPDSTIPEEGASYFIWPYRNEQSKCVTRRLVFHDKALAALKDKVVAADSDKLLGKRPSSFMAATALLWKSAMAAREVRSGCKRPSVLSFPVNIRTRISPPLPSSSVGNILGSAVAQCMERQTTDLELHSVVGLLKNALAGINSNYIEERKGEAGARKAKEFMDELNEIHSRDCREVDYYAVTSWCSGGAYGADFGWGKPIWVFVGNSNADISALRNIIFLMDTRSGDGIEAWVTFNHEDTAVFEQDPNIIQFASLDPSPLDFLISA